MYCVYCGVRLQEGVRECPLCHTKVQIMEEGGTQEAAAWPDRYPHVERTAGRILAISLISVILLAAALGCLIFCLKSRGGVAWSGIAGLGMALFWVWVVLPSCFRRWRPMVFLPLDFACAAGYLLYICEATGGRWFLSFAFPVTALAALLTLTGVAMMRYIVQGRLRLMSLLVIAIGLSFMLVEFFQHITFGTPMFVWSLYVMSVFVLAGVFLLVASFIPSLRLMLRKTFFY